MDDHLTRRMMDETHEHVSTSPAQVAVSYPSMQSRPCPVTSSNHFDYRLTIIHLSNVM